MNTPPSTGHNVGGAGQLKSIVERIERLDEEKKTIADDIRDVKVLRKLIAIRKQDPAQRAEQNAIMETYLHALGMLSQ